jgi:hypothetical protein
MNKAAWIKACCTATLALAAQMAAAQSAPLRAGAAKVDITPPASLFPLVGGQTYGSVHDPLFARALVLDNGAGKVALITADLANIRNSAELLDAVTAATGIPAERIFMTATHNHNSPTVQSARDTRYSSPYFAVMKQGIVDAARKAVAALQPARIGYGTGKAYVNTNRDEKIGEGYHMGYAPEGPSDKTVAVVTVTTPAGKPIAVYANYAVHGVVMYRSRTRDGQVQITGDLPGATSAYVEDRLGNGAVALWTSGAAGDQNPLFMSTYNQDAPDVHDEGEYGWAIQDVQARRLGQEIVRVAGATTNTRDRAQLWAGTASVTCPGQQRAAPPAPGEPAGGYLAPAKVPMVDGPPVTIPLGLIMIDDIALAGVSAEVFTEIGQNLKKQSPFDRTMMVTHLNESIGYIPTDKAYLMPAEKALTNRLKPGCAEPAMISAFQQMMARYLAEGRQGKVK